MSDLSSILPSFPTGNFARLFPPLERAHIATTDLLTLDAAEIAKRAQLPPLEVKKLSAAVLHALHADLGIGDGAVAGKSRLRKTGEDLVRQWRTISTLDDGIDAAFGGGVPAGYVTEITGESGAGKTQFLLSLLLSTQLPAPRGLQRSALYISTESRLPTTRLTQLLACHPYLSQLPADEKPSLDRVVSIVTADLESQDHILNFQVPVAIRRHNIGLLIIDSVTANYRAEFERPGASRHGARMAKRTADLVRLGTLLRNLAREENLAVVVSNQVADRFPSTHTPADQPATSTPSSPLAARSTAIAPASSPSVPRRAYDPLSLDHQQRFFTGWGDTPGERDLKTPSLGLVWTRQVACRVALIKRPVYGNHAGQHEEWSGEEKTLKGWRRWVKVVFCAWAPSSGRGLDEGAVEFEITRGGMSSLALRSAAKCER